MDILAALTAGMGEMGVRAPPSAPAVLARYIDLLVRWNRAYNLTAVRDPADMVTRHVLDSLGVLPWVAGARVVDVGSGAGLPGIPLAVVRPELEVTLLDSNGKKTRFMQHAVSTLGLARVQVVQARVERWTPPQPFDTVVCRAFAELGEIWRRVAHLCAPGARLLALKGAVDRREIAALPDTARVVAVHPVRIPGLDAERHVVHVEAAAAA